MLIVVVWFGCVYVLHITRTKLKIAFFALGAQAKIRYFGSLSVAPRPPTVNIFVSYYAQAPYQQYCACWWGLIVFMCSISLEPS
jgi:hypothetical protein